MIKFIFIARPAKHKGLADLLTVLRQLMQHSWNLTIVGEVGNDNKELLALAPVEFSRRIILAGSKPHEEIPIFLRASDVLLVASHYENFCNTALEALACGVPVIGPALGGLKDMVTMQQNGILFKARDLDSMRNAVEWVCQNKHCIDEMSENSNQVAKSYHWPIIFDITVDLLSSICDQRNRGVL